MKYFGKNVKLCATFSGRPRILHENQ